MSPEDAASFRLIEERIRRAWKDNIVVPCEHAEEMLDGRDIDISDVRNVLFNGRIVERRQEGECTRYVYRSKSIDGDALRCVIEIDEHDVIIIVTVFRPGTQGKKKWLVHAAKLTWPAIEPRTPSRTATS
jgi:hypothetical protein